MPCLIHVCLLEALEGAGTWPVVSDALQLVQAMLIGIACISCFATTSIQWLASTHILLSRALGLLQFQHRAWVQKCPVQATRFTNTPGLVVSDTSFHIVPWMCLVKSFQVMTMSHELISGT
jgi:hypothetical protein